jgi:hypothetical protein
MGMHDEFHALENDQSRYIVPKVTYLTNLLLHEKPNDGLDIPSKSKKRTRILSMLKTFRYPIQF